MDFGFHLQPEMPCSTEQCACAQGPEVSSDTKIEKKIELFLSIATEFLKNQGKEYIYNRCKKQ